MSKGRYKTAPDVKMCLYFSFEPGVRSGCGQRYRRLRWTFTIPSAVILPKKTSIKLVAEAGGIFPVGDFQSKIGSTCSVVFFNSFYVAGLNSH